MKDLEDFQGFSLEKFYKIKKFLIYFYRELRDMGDGFSLSENMTNQFALKRLKFIEIMEKQKKLNEINQRINLALALDLEQNRLLD